ncbi:hypothetical protein DEO72_LG7g2636 [Vigna unguiculata]|uniref:Uncharacterized protein n=1 Tax=Vigna unguiculata TaxID=3917 RepID=A0A4D6MIJ1_VIGUN|nr:hypothetical protein DEO72_LG7g2636 [Vigna unguiculata]
MFADSRSLLLQGITVVRGQRYNFSNVFCVEEKLHFFNFIFIVLQSKHNLCFVKTTTGSEGCVTVSNLKNVGFDKWEKLIARQLIFFFFSQKIYFHSSSISSSSIKRQIYIIGRKPFDLKSLGASDGYLVNHNPHDPQGPISCLNFILTTTRAYAFHSNDHITF